MAIRKASYLIRKGESFYVRIVVPLELQAVVGRREIRRSLSTTDLLVGRLRALEFVEQAKRLFERVMPKKKFEPPTMRALFASLEGLKLIEPISAGELDAFIKASRALGIGTAQLVPTKSLLELLTLYIAEREDDWAPRSKEQNRRTIERYADFCDKSGLSPFVKPTASEFKATVLRPAMEVITLNKEIGRLQTFFNWCKDNGHITGDNPFTRLKVRDKNAGVGKREEYSYAEVELMLSRLNPAADPRHFLPLICLYAGTRVREAAQLRVQDVQVVQGVHCLVVTESEDDELMSVKSGKPRQVPIHSELLRRGLLAYVEELQVKGQTRLFPMFKGHTTDGYGDAAGRWFRRTFRTKIGLKRGVHELRNTYITGLNEAGVPESHVNALAGHALGRSTSLKVYAGAVSMPTLKAALDKLLVNPGRKA